MPCHRGSVWDVLLLPTILSLFITALKLKNFKNNHFSLPPPIYTILKWKQKIHTNIRNVMKMWKPLFKIFPIYHSFNFLEWMMFTHTFHYHLPHHQESSSSSLSQLFDGILVWFVSREKNGTDLLYVVSLHWFTYAFMFVICIRKIGIFHDFHHHLISKSSDIHINCTVTRRIIVCWANKWDLTLVDDVIRLIKPHDVFFHFHFESKHFAEKNESMEN